MKNIYRIIVACLVPLTLLLAQAQTAQGVGYGLTKDAAIEQAKRDAVENGLGAYISSETVVTATSLSDNIYSKAQGFVKKFNIVKEKKDPDGNWEITISAEVTQILDQVMQDEVAMQTLLNSMNRPRIIFLLREMHQVYYILYNSLQIIFVLNFLVNYYFYIFLLKIRQQAVNKLVIHFFL